MARALLALLWALRAPPVLAKRPNILFLMTDSMDGRVLDPEAVQSQAVELPFLRDFFAKQGTNFVRTYANSPQCVPSRSSMCTGRRTDQIEAWSNEKGLAASEDGTLDKTCIYFYGTDQCAAWAKMQNYSETIFSGLQRLGYGVKLYGKVDIGAGLMNDPKVRETVSASGWHQGANLAILTRSADIRRPTKQAPLSLTSDTQDHVHPEDWRTVDHCQEWIQALPPAEQNTEPFFLYCSLNIPHPPFQTNATWLAKVKEEKIPLPHWPPGFPQEWHPYDSYMSISKHVEEMNYTSEEILRVRKTYYAMCAEADYLLNRVWESLTQKGYGLDNTFVVYVSDHGEMNMEHRQVWKNSMYEGSSRVPFAIAGPGVAKGRRVTQLTSLVDVLPTLLDMGQETDWERHADLAGKSLLLLAGAPSLAPPQLVVTPDEDRAVVSQYHSNMGNTGSFMVRKGPWKYIRFGHTLSTFSPEKYTPLLFNVDEDPGEAENLAGQHSQILGQLEVELRAFFDPEDVDRRVKSEDFRLYHRFFGSLDQRRLRNKLERAYAGFDEGDFRKLQLWAKELASWLAPELLVV